jgi:lysine/ornithine N-monooxygenase
MPDRLDVAVVGAGPFGMSIAASLPGRAVRVFGKPMETWRTRMPPDMLLRSAWQETSLAAYGAAGDIDAWAAATDETREEPIPLQKFLRYCDWFRERFVSDADEADVALVERTAGGFRGFRITTTAGDEADVAALVVAVGVTPFPYAPPPFVDAIGERVEFATDHASSAGYAGRRLLVIGGGQNALETAGAAAGEGAIVELALRSSVRWFADREPANPRSPLGQRLYRLAYPVLGYGPPPINRLVLYPDLWALLPRDLRRALSRRLLRAGGSPFLRELIEGKVTVTEGVTATRLEPTGDVVRVTFDDGCCREFDHVLLATGYRFSLDRLSFLAPDVRSAIRVELGWPVLDRAFRSTDPRILFVGYAAEGRFGPASRFVLGAPFTARRVCSALA